MSPDAKTATGDWGGRRSELAERGITVSLFLNHQYQAVVKEGRDTNQGRSSASVDFFLAADLAKLELVPNADVFLHLQSNWGAGVNPRTGAILEVNDDADGDLGLHVAQLWYRHRFLERKLSLTLGFLDFQTLVDRNAFANSEDKQFMHQALDNNPLVPLSIGLGAAILYQPVSWYSVSLGAGDAQSVLYKPGFSTAFHEDAYFFGYMENALHPRWDTERGPLPGNYRAGVVYDPRFRAEFLDRRQTPRSEGDDYGAYAGFDQLVVREGPDDEQGLGVFGRFGYRTPQTNRFARFWSAGVQYLGLIPGRDTDVLGFGVALDRGSRLNREFVNPRFDNETVYEAYYAIQITKWFVLTPDVQYVDNPGAAGGVGHAVVAAVRARVSF